MSAPPSRCAKPLALRVGKLDQRLVVAGRDQHGVMKLMSAHDCTSLSYGAVGQKRSLAVAEMKLASCKARGMTEQAGHGMADAVGVLERLAENHVSSALAVHRAGRRKSCEPLAKALRGSQSAGVELRVAAGQPAGVAVRWRRLVG